MDCEKIPKDKNIRKKVCVVINKNKQFLANVGIGFWLFMLIIFISFLFLAVSIENTIAFLISDYGMIAVFVLSILLDFIMQPIGPDIPLIIALLGGLANKWVILAVVIVGSNIALAFAYYVGKKVGSHGMEKIVGKKNYSKIMKYSRYGMWYLFISAFSPLPYIPYLAGMWNLSFRQVLFYIVIPRAIRFAVVMYLTLRIGGAVMDHLLLL